MDPVGPIGRSHGAALSYGKEAGGMLNKLKIFVFAVMYVFIVSCTTEVQRSDVTVKRGLVYRSGDDRPFSGVVTGKGREGHRRCQCRYEKHYKDGLLQGRSYFYYENGKLESVEPYDKGRLNGMLVQYYPNGKIKARIHLVDGKRGGDKGEMFWPSCN